PQKGFVNEIAIVKEMGPVYEEIANSFEQVEQSNLTINQKIQEISLEEDPYKRMVLERVVKSLTVKRSAYQEIYQSAVTKDPKIARAHTLVEYKKGLHSEGHIAMTPSVAKYVEEIEKKMRTGDPMFLHGPTGTGKTSIARLAAEELTGKTAEMVYCNQQTRESNIWGKTGVRGDGKGGSETFDILGPLARAIKEGKPIIFDEFNSLEEDQMRIIKGVFGYKPGDEVPITGNGKIKMAQGFQIICTANLKSEKHTDRRDLPDEIKREFEQNNIEVNYNPKHESFDIMLARLMNQNGSIDLSWHDMNVTLPKFAEAIESIQQAYSGNLSDDEAKSIGVMNASNAKSELKSFVMTQGSVESILDQWKIETKIAKSGKTNEGSKTFAEFIDERLKTALTFKAYSQEDRVLAAKIFALKGFLKTVSAEEMNLPKDIFNGVKIKAERGGEEEVEELKEKSLKIVHITLSEIADLDPFDIRPNKINPLEDFSTDHESLEGDDFSKSLEKRLAKIRKGKREQVDSITAEYTRKNPETNVIEHQESITINIEEKLQEFISLYQETNIDTPPDFEDQIREIWSRNNTEIQETIEKNGFDNILLVPASLNLAELAEEMKMENGNYTGTNFDNGGGFAGAKSVGADKPRIILYHKKTLPEIQEKTGIDVHLNIKAGEAEKLFKQNPDQYLSTLEDFIVFERKNLKDSNKHFSKYGENSGVWLSGTKSGARFVCSYWRSDGGLIVDASGADHSISRLGVRPSR
ncbi:MAG: AAA family ATPase, partial [bacterium]